MGPTNQLHLDLQSEDARQIGWMPQGFQINPGRRTKFPHLNIYGVHRKFLFLSFD